MNEATISTLEVYERWAPAYPPEPHNPLMQAEQAAMLARVPDLRGKRVLDLACGSGRYARLLAEAGAADVVAADFSVAMLSRVTAARRVRAELTRLPFASACFDFIVSGLALGHAADLALCMREIARVLRPGASIRYSDFHADAERAGLTRSFRDATNRTFTLPPGRHGLEQHRAAVEGAGLRIESVQELRAGREVCAPFRGSDEFYRRWRDLPLVFVIEARR